MKADWRERAPYLVATIAIIITGVIWRRADLGLPFPWWKYGGSTLWGAMVMALMGLIAPRARLGGRGAAALAVAVVVEFSRLYHTPWLDAFRLTLAGALLLGRLFSPWNILAYTVGIAAAGAVETALWRTRQKPT